MSRFWDTFGTWYFITIDVLLILGIIIFINLPKEKKAEFTHWYPLLILIFTVFYETLAAYGAYNYHFNKWVNEAIGNAENPQYNLWLYNIAYQQILIILYLFLIKSWLPLNYRKGFTWMMVLFVISVIFLQASGIEPVYAHQKINFALGANMILLGTGLYFIGLMTSPDYLHANPLRLISFWQMTFLLFTFSLTYINSVFLEYLWHTNPNLGKSLMHIDYVMGLLNLSILVLAISTPLLKNIFETEPYYGKV